MRILAPIFALAIVIAAAAPARAVNYVYWTDIAEDKIHRRAIGSTVTEDIITTGLIQARGLAIDSVNQKLYWTDLGTDLIERSNLDGTGRETLISSGLSNPTGIVVDPVGGNFFWADEVTANIRRRAIAGGAVSVVVSGLSSPEGVALDRPNGLLYFSQESGTIRRVSMTGTDLTSSTAVVTGLSTPGALALDLVNRRVYFGDFTLDAVGRSDMDTLNGNLNTSLVASLDPQFGIEVDAVNNRFFWVERGTGTIRTGSLTGSVNPQDFVTGLSSPWGLALYITGADPVPEPGTTALAALAGVALLRARRRRAAK